MPRPSSEISRRALMTGVSALAVAEGVLSPTDASAAPAAPSVSVGPGDARYAELATGVNKRWAATPEAIRLVASTEQVVQAVTEAVRARKRVSVRSGGHCYADFVHHPDTDVIIDTSALNGIAYDPARNAFAIGAGAQLGQIYEALYKEWGVTIPGGACLTVGIGGHASGGGFGPLTRRFGLVADHIEAVEMVVVDASGRVRTVVASRAPSDPHRDLWWATAGGGGGSFGVITRYWFRSPAATGTTPGLQLPAPPREVLVSLTEIPWSRLDAPSMARLVRNFCAWHVDNGATSSPFISLSGYLLMRQGATGGAALFTQVDGTDPDADRLLADYAAALTAGTGLTASFPSRRVPWLASTKLLGTSSPVLLYDHTLRSAVKTAWLKGSFTDAQLAVMYRYLTRTDYSNPNAVISLNGGGGRTNDTAPDATAVPHRDAALIALYENFWIDRREDDKHLAWLRDLYRESFQDTGGVPVPNDLTGGCYINDPDPDLSDPAWNASGVPWHTLYWRANYARLQQVKARWDPTDFFRHSQSIRLP